MNRGQRPSVNEIDWQAVRERLARAFVSAQGALRPTAERAEEILAARAHQLARPSDEARPAGRTISVLAFSLGTERYAIKTQYAREVLRFADFTLIPGMPDFVVGIINVRGELLVVFDLQRLFGMPSRGLTDRSWAIVCGETDAEFGIVADTVDEVMSLSVDDLVRQPSLPGALGLDSIEGVTRTAVIVLDGAALLRDRRLSGE